VFRTALLRQAYAQAQRDGFTATDDAMLVERLGVPVQIVPGELGNRKITTAEDLRWAEWYVTQRT
jgi:2-C-methyl-D-erythritol 4-phosphate cytidylyltransferase